jgi:FkbM family methyltransferase
MGLKRRWDERSYYRSNKDWLLAVYNRLLTRVTFGKHLPFWRNAVRVGLRGLDKPLLVRLGTTDWLVLEEIFVHGDYDVLLKSDPGKLKLILDLGANVGYSVRFWQQHFTDSRIIAVEPDCENAALLQKNAKIGGESVLVVPVCVTGWPRQVFLDKTGGEWSFSMSDLQTDESKSIEGLTLLQILERCAIPEDDAIDLLKVDIEGAEAELFATSGTWLNRVRNMLVEIHQPRYSTQKFLEDLDSAGIGAEQFSITILDEMASFVLIFLQRKE